MISPDHLLDPTTSSPLPRESVPARAPGTYLNTFYQRTLSGLPHDELPTLEPGTRSRISARFIAPGQEIPRARRGGAPLAGGRSPRPSGDVCAEPLRLEGSPETQGVPSSGAGPSQNGTCSECGIGRKIRAGSAVIFFGWVGSESITPVSLHRVEEWVLSGQNLSKQSYNGSFLLLARSCMHDICGFWR